MTRICCGNVIFDNKEYKSNVPLGKVAFLDKESIRKLN